MNVSYDDIVIYSAVFGKFDMPSKPSVKGLPPYKFIYFTDRHNSLKVWDTRIKAKPVTGRHQARLLARYFKTHPPRKYKYSVWIDSNVQLLVDPMKYIEKMGDAHIWVHRHKYRMNIRQEAKAVVQLKRIKPAIVDRQVRAYSNAGFTDQVDLPETGLLIRRHCEEVDNFNNMWWTQIETICIRDQMSFGYCAWKMGLKIKWFPGCIQNNKIVRLRVHGAKP